MTEEKKQHLYCIEFTTTYGSTEFQSVAIFDDRQISQKDALRYLKKERIPGEDHPNIVILTKEQARNVFGMKNLS